MTDYQQILDELIAEAKELQVVYASAKRDFNPWTAELTDKLNLWYTKAERWLNLNYTEDPQAQDFKMESGFAISLKKKAHFDKMVRILDAIQLMPETKVKPVPNIDNSVNVNVAQQQEQTQSQQQSFELFIEAIKDDLTGRQQKELKQIMQSEDELAEKRTKVIDKLKSFGIDVLSNIMANIVTNPAIYSFLG